MKKCSQKKCLKEIDPKGFPGIFFGGPYEYEESWLGGLICTKENRRFKCSIQGINKKIIEMGMKHP